VECNTPLKSFQGELQVCFKPHLIRRSKQRAITSQSLESPNRDSFGTPPWESWDKSHSDVGVVERCKEYYMGEGGGFLRVRAMMSLVSSKLHVACPSTKGAPEINQLVGWFDVGSSK